MIATAGHIALIIPRYATVPTARREIGIYRYQGSRRWETIPPRPTTAIPSHWSIGGSMDSYGLSDSLHRLVKQAVDSGEASSIAEAETLFRRYTLTFEIGETEAGDSLHQGAL